MTRYEPSKKKRQNRKILLDEERDLRTSSYSKEGLRKDEEMVNSKKRGNKRTDIYDERAAKNRVKREYVDERGDIYDESDDYYEEDRGKKKKKMPKGLKAIVIIIIILLILAGGLYFAMNSILQPAKRTNLDDAALGITKTTASSAQKVVLFGIDGDENYSGGRSDTIIIAAIDRKSRTIKLISILRDTRVDIEGYGANKINAAYAYGGAQLALKTLNQNFNQDLKKFVTVDFSKLSDIVNMVGGVDIDITVDEAGQINSFCPYDTPVYEGVSHLSGDQAVAYSRIRNLDSDYYRAERQQKVINSIFQSFKNMSLTQYPGFINNLMDTVETSMSTTEVLSFAMAYKDYDMQSYTIPDPNYEQNLWSGIDESGQWVWTYDLAAAGQRIDSIVDGSFQPVAATEGE